MTRYGHWQDATLAQAIARLLEYRDAQAARYDMVPFDDASFVRDVRAVLQRACEAGPKQEAA